MLNYSIKIEGQYIDEKNNAYLVMKIYDLTSTESRQIRVRYNTLEDLHNSIQNDNQYQELPEFPPKDATSSYFNKFKGVFMMNGQDSKKQYNLEAALNEYYKKLFRSYNRSESLMKFLRDQPDAIRQQDLLKHEKSFNTKADLMKYFTILDKQRVDEFKKIYTVIKTQDPSKEYILNRYKLPNNEQFERLKKQYYENQVKITDFSNICEVQSIFKLRGQGGLASIWTWGRGEKKDKNEKTSIFLQMNFAVDEKHPHEFLWSVEERWGTTLEKDIEERRKKNKHYKFDELLSLAQSLVQAIHDLHKIDLPHKNIRPSNICISNNISKVSSIAEPIQEYREWKNQSKNYQELPYLPPESISTYGNSNYGYYKSQSVNQYKLDAWSMGITLLQAATLSKISEMKDIHQQSSKWLNQSLQTVQEQYGSGMASILTVMTLKNPNDRADLQEQLQQIFQTHLIPMKYEYLENTFNLIQPIKTIRYSLNTLNEITLKKFHLDIQENQKQAPPIYEITISLSESVTDQEISILLDQFKIISIKQLRLIFDKFDAYERIGNLIEILGTTLKDLIQLEIILKENFQFQNSLEVLINALNKLKKLKLLKIDLLRCQTGEQDVTTFSLNLIDNQSQTIKIYTHHDLTGTSNRIIIINPNPIK